MPGQRRPPRPAPRATRWARDAGGGFLGPLLAASRPRRAAGPRGRAHDAAIPTAAGVRSPPKTALSSIRTASRTPHSGGPRADPCAVRRRTGRAPAWPSTVAACHTRPRHDRRPRRRRRRRPRLPRPVLHCGRSDPPQRTHLLSGQRARAQRPIHRPVTQAGHPAYLVDRQPSPSRRRRQPLWFWRHTFKLQHEPRSDLVSKDRRQNPDQPDVRRGDLGRTQRRRNRHGRLLDSAPNSTERPALSHTGLQR